MSEPQPWGSEIEVGLARYGSDARPEYNPAALVGDVQAVLIAAGIPIDLTTSRLNVAVHAAADLLRALGVRPATAPVRRLPS